MPPAATGLGKETVTSMDDLAKHLECMEEVLRTLTGKVGDIDQQQQGMFVAVLRLEKKVAYAGDDLPADSNPVFAHQSAAPRAAGDTSSVAPRLINPQAAVPPHRRPTMNVDDNGDFLLTYHKLDFPKYDESIDPLPWLTRCEHNFRIHRTPDHKRVSYASFHLLDDAQLLFHRMELNGGTLPWPEFTRLLNVWFGPPMTDTPLGELAFLHRTGSVDDLCGRFMSLSCRDHTLTSPSSNNFSCSPPASMILFTPMSHSSSRPR
jgi:hypothetical protein